MNVTKNANKKMLVLLFVVAGILITLVGIFSTIAYAKSYFIENSDILDDLQSGIVTCFFIMPLGLYLFNFGMMYRKSTLLTPSQYGDKFVCIPLAIFQIIGVLTSSYVAIKFDLVYIVVPIILLLIALLLIFVMRYSGLKPGRIARRSKKFVACTFTHSFYIDGVDVFDTKNQIGRVNKKVDLFRFKKIVGEVESVYIIKGKTTHFYVAIFPHKSGAELIYFVNLKPILYFLANDLQSVKVNVESNIDYVKEKLKDEYKFHENLAYKIEETSEGYQIEILAILYLPSFIGDLKIKTHLPLINKTCSSLEEAEQELDQFINCDIR